MRYRIAWRRSAKRMLQTELPEGVAMAVFEFVTGPLAENPHRVGHPCRGQYEGYHSARRGDYRIIYRIIEDQVVVDVVKIDHRRDAYR